MRLAASHRNLITALGEVRRRYSVQRFDRYRTPEARTTTAQNLMPSPSAYRWIADITSRSISFRFSGGIRWSKGRNGVATACACSQTSSAVPGQVHGSVVVFSSMFANPALRNSSDKLPGVENLNGSGPPGTSTGPSTCFATMPIVLDQYGCSNGPHTRKQVLALGLSTRCTSRSALAQF